MKNLLELGITTAWQNNARWLIALRPLSKTYGLISEFHKNRYKNGKKPIYKAPIPVLVIGNITVGGSGKTPLIIALVRYLQQKNIAVGVISRGYGGNEKTMPTLVVPTSQPSEVGDEPCLIFGETGVPMAVCPNRGQAVELLMTNHPNLQLIISDDGLQHYKLYRDDEWIVVDTERGFGNGKLFPEGFLREPISRLQNATVIYHYANEANAKKSKFCTTVFLKTGKLIHLLDCHRKFDSSIKTVYALTGIGYPVRFFYSLKNLGFKVMENPRPDHYHFKLTDIKQLQDFPIVVTTKDAVKIRQLVTDDNCKMFDNVWVLPVEMELSQGVRKLMDNFLEHFIER